MILEAFSDQLHLFYQQGYQPVEALHVWLDDILEDHPAQGDHVARVIHAEICRTETPEGLIVYEGASPSGRVLLSSLYDYCKSYDNWQFRRWLHKVQATDFSSFRQSNT